MIAVIAVAGIAVLVQSMPSTGFDGEQVQTLDRAYAPLWLLVALIDHGFGLDPLSWHIGDVMRSMRRDRMPLEDPGQRG